MWLSRTDIINCFIQVGKQLKLTKLIYEGILSNKENEWIGKLIMKK